MTGFRIEPAKNGMCARIHHEDHGPYGVATVHDEGGGRLYVGPVAYENAPPPLTGAPMWFETWDALRGFLSIPKDEREDTA